MKLYLSLMVKSRQRKYKHKVLDVGADNEEYKESDNFLEKKYPFKNNITALGVKKLNNFSKKYPEVKAITYDGKFFPFKDNSFEFVWSNAVLEHVGGKLRQELFISEMIRVAKKKIVFTTPDITFPIELHTKLPFIHWLRKERADRIYASTGKKWATKDYMHLLNKKDLIIILTKMQVKYSFDYKIVHNRLLGLTATFTVLVNKK